MTAEELFSPVAFFAGSLPKNAMYLPLIWSTQTVKTLMWEAE